MFFGALHKCCIELGLHDGQQFIMESERSLGYSIPTTDAQGLLPQRKQRSNEITSEHPHGKASGFFRSGWKPTKRIGLYGIETAWELKCGLTRNPVLHAQRYGLQFFQRCNFHKRSHYRHNGSKASHVKCLPSTACRKWLTLPKFCGISLKPVHS